MTLPNYKNFTLYYYLFTKKKTITLSLIFIYNKLKINFKFSNIFYKETKEKNLYFSYNKPNYIKFTYLKKATTIAIFDTL